MNRIVALLKNRNGQDTIEYALICGLVATAATAISPAVAAVGLRFGVVLGILNQALNTTAGQ